LKSYFTPINLGNEHLKNKSSKQKINYELQLNIQILYIYDNQQVSKMKNTNIKFQMT